MTTTKNSATPADDSFELYDLRVEVVCPPGERIMCGAKEGDYFTLQGEMMYLPPGQGISVYSLGEDRPNWFNWFPIRLYAETTYLPRSRTRTEGI